MYEKAVKAILIMSLFSYYSNNNRTGFETVEAFLVKCFRGDNEVRQYLEQYRIY